MKVSEQIIDVIEVLCEKFGIVIDWSAETILPYIQTLIEKYSNYVVGTRIFGISFCLAVFIAYSIFYAAWWHSQNKDCNYIDWDNISPVMITGTLIIIVVANLIAIPILATNIVEAMYMPEVSLIKYIEGYISTH